jgi:hypothetical protein
MQQQTMNMMSIDSNSNGYKVCKTGKSVVLLIEYIFNDRAPVPFGKVVFDYIERNIIGYRVRYFFCPLPTSQAADGMTRVLKSSFLSSLGRNNEYKVASAFNGDTTYVTATDTTDIIAYHNLDWGSDFFGEGAGPISFDAENKNLTMFSQPQNIKEFDWRIETLRGPFGVISGNRISINIEFFYACDCK